MDEEVLLLLVEEGGYLEELEVGVWEGVLEVGGLVAGQEGVLEGGQGDDQVEVQEAEDEAWDPSNLQAYQEASGTEEHLEGDQEVGQREDQEAS